MSSIEYLPENVFIQCDNISLDISHNGKKNHSTSIPMPMPISIYQYQCNNISLDISHNAMVKEPSIPISVYQFQCNNIPLSISNNGH